MMNFDEAKTVLDTFSKPAKLYRNNKELDTVKVVKLDKSFLTQYAIEVNDIIKLENKNYKVLSVLPGPNQLFFEGTYVLIANN